MNCGGLLQYDIEKGQLLCESCDSLFDPEGYSYETDAKEEYDNNRYVSAIGDSTIDASAGLYNSEFDIKSLNFTVGGAWNKHTGRTRITPMLALNYTELKRDGFAENGVQNHFLGF